MSKTKKPVAAVATLMLAGVCAFAPGKEAKAAPSAAKPGTTNKTTATKTVPGLVPLPAAPGAPAAAPGSAPAKPAGASAKPGAPAKPAASMIDTKDYVLDVDDVINIISLTHEEVKYQGLIPADGKVNIPEVGPVAASGKTLLQLQREVLRKMSSAGLINATVTVSLQQPRSQKIFVQKPKGANAVVEITPNMRISDVVAATNGFGDYPVELIDASLNRPGIAKAILLDLPAIMRDTNSKANILVKNNDTLRLVARTVQVTFAGRVTKSGIADVPVGSNLVEAVALAGGVADKAALTKASLKRLSGEVIPINLYDVLIRGQQPPNIKLADGDLILIPEAQDRVTAQGAFGHPGYYDIEDGKTLKISELVALAGGPGASAALTRTTVQHADGSSQVIDLYRVLALHDQEINIDLKPDDIITIPSYTPQVIVAGSGVRSSNYIPIPEGQTLSLLGALTKSGSLAGEPEAVKIQITRNIPGAIPELHPDPNQQPTILTIDPVKLYKDNDINANVPLQDGDVIMVTLEPRKVYVAGEVRQTGVVEINAKEGLTELLTRCGGVTEDGLLSGVIVERGGQKFTVDVFAALTHGDAVDFPLQTNDNVVVPKNMNRVLILPGVGDPGYHAIPEDRPMTVVEALALARGTTRTAELKKVVLLHSTAKGMEQQPMPLDTPDQWIQASKVIMKPGDILFVPDRLPRTSASLGRKVLGLLPFANMLTGNVFPLF